ncbi:MAG TPA: carboxypeptidase regulatory-like domain-containing protein [Terriglobia bacterium]|nr:carboxypeptidase regulatory-like domain-containing protein [Terriglobia bacterium]
MHKMQVLKISILGSLIFLFSANLALADELYGKIRGTISDPSGALMAGMKVTATNVDTGISTTVTSASDGSYEFLQLVAPAAYTVSAERAGFKTSHAKNIHLNLNQTYVLAIVMELGEVSQQVNVEASTAQVETTSMQLGATLTSSSVTDLPLNGRNWVTLQTTLPGVVAGSDRFAGNANFSTSGSRTQANSYLVNGTDANDLTLNNPLIIPSPDAIAEVRVITNTINPEYGRNGGAVLNAETKSGTNKFHGDGFEFFRDTSLNTRNYFRNDATVFHQNQYGGTVGGPIKKDKTFFFFSYQGTRNRRPQPGQPGTSTVFTQDQRNGIFSDLATSSGVSPFPLVGENGTTFKAGTPYSTIFPTGHIPAADLNPVSVNLTNKFVPLPNTGTNLFSFNPTETQTTDQYITRIDHNFSNKDSIFGYWFIEPNKTLDPISFLGGDLPGFGETDNQNAQHYTLAWNHTFNGSTLNEVRLGYNRFNFHAVNPTTPVLPSSVGFTGINPQDPQGAGVPFVNLTGFFSLGFSVDGPQPRISNTYQLTDNFSKIVGRHTLKFGFDFRPSQVENPFFFNNNGSFTFAGGGTFSSGDPGADFLLGIPDSYSQSSGGFIDARTKTYYLYAQDQFKFRPNLTLTYGTGWEVDTPLQDKFNGGLAVNCFRPGEQSTVFPTAPAGLVFPGDPGCNSAGGVTTKYGHFAPRIGFAWSPKGSSKTSIHGGYGIYYNRTEEELALENLQAPPFSVSSAGIGDQGGSPSFINPFADINTGNAIPNKFPFTPAKPGSPVNFSLFEPFSLNVFDPNFSVPYSENYNLTVERELPGQMILSVAYVGLVGHKLTSVSEQNPAGSEFGNPICAATPGCNSFNSFATAPQSFRYPQTNANGVLVFGSVGQQGTFVNSNYNSLQVSLDKHLSRGLQFRAAYTYSHSLDNGSSFEDFGSGLRASDPFNRQNDYGDSGFDARNRFVLNYVYDIPSVRRFGAFARVPARLVEGWKISGITTFQSGFPISVYDGGFRSFECDAAFSFYGCFDRPNVVGPVQTLNPRTSSVANQLRGLGSQNSYFFNPNAFALEALGTQGNAGRNFFHGPGIDNTDISLSKDTSITDSTRLELRFELFNAFNHTQFNPVQISGGANGNSNSINFGRILGAQGSRVAQLGAKIYF